MILNLNIKRGFSFKPFIGVPNNLVGTAAYDAYVAHEMTHYERQGYFPAIWVAKYFTDKKFRYQEELLAFKAEIAKMRETGIRVNIHQFAMAMSTEYWGMIDYDTAYKDLMSA